MRLIKKIEVKYLRSLYDLKLDKAGDLNVIFGRNDSGKSNLLRALNLFFNGKPEPYQDFDFSLDMSDIRKAEARAAKGKQFFWIKITFSLPPNYQNALGEEITIKKQWNRDGDVTQTIMGTSSIPQGRLTRFLNDIDFTYIPAVKDLNVYADLIERMYGAAAETPQLSKATTDFINAISGQATDLTKQLSQIFNTVTNLAPPTDMQLLFRNLDFSHGTERHSLFRQKGDGVKARHLPELLHFINQNEMRKKYYLWGFEEPENSLDLGAAKEEAQRFASFSKRADTQIFVTSHSPAFYLTETEPNTEVRRYFITKQKTGTGKEVEPRNAAKPIDVISDAETEMQQAGLLQLPFVIRKMEEYSKKMEEIERQRDESKSTLEKLQNKLEQITRPTLFVEGPHDVKLFTSAIERTGNSSEVEVVSLGGTPDTTFGFFKAILERDEFHPSAKSLFLFDNDKAGRSSFRVLTNTKNSSIKKDEATLVSGNMLAWVLPFSDEFEKFIKNYNIRPDQAFFTAEFLYPADFSATLCEKLTNKDPNGFSKWKKCIHETYHKSLKQIDSIDLNNAKEGSPDWFFARGVPDSLKEKFAQEASDKGFGTDNIDNITTIIVRTLTDSKA